jgi:hypothetical protein
VSDRVKLPPWALEDAPAWWVERVRVAVTAEHAAQAEIRRREERRAKARQASRGSGGR